MSQVKEVDPSHKFVQSVITELKLGTKLDMGGYSDLLNSGEYHAVLNVGHPIAVNVMEMMGGSTVWAAMVGKDDIGGLDAMKAKLFVGQRALEIISKRVESLCNHVTELQWPIDKAWFAAENGHIQTINALLDQREVSDVTRTISSVGYLQRYVTVYHQKESDIQQEQDLLEAASVHLSQSVLSAIEPEVPQILQRAFAISDQQSPQV